MHWFVLLQIIISILYVAYLVYNYSIKTVGLFVKLSVYLTWLICFSNVFLLPYDIYFSLQQDYTMGVVWKTSYALIFFLTWILLPIAQEFESAGEFSIKQKLKRAIINNLIIYGIFAGVGLLGLAYLIISGKINMASLPPMLLAASTAFGMFLLVIFLSYGIVAIPRSLWRYKNYKIKLKKYQFEASTIIRKKQAILQQLQLHTKQLLWKISQSGETVETVEIRRLIPSELVQKWEKKIPDLGEVNVVKLNKQIKQLTLELSRLDSRWEELTIAAFKVEDILTYMNASNRRIQSTIFNHYSCEVFNFIQWIWHCRIKVFLMPFLAVLFGIFAIGIIIAELAVFIPAIKPMNPFSHLTNIRSFIYLDCVLLILLGYMAFCVYYALFKLKFSRFYGLYWNQQTDAASLIFFAINCSRITNPLNYNFLQVINDNETSFVQAMGETPVLNNSFKLIFPILMIILILFNACDMYTWICKRFGFNKFQFESQFDHENIDEGRRLLMKARTDLQTKILNSNCKNLEEFRSYKSECVSTVPLTNKQSSSSEQLHLQPKYFNEFADMEKVKKIFDM